MASGLNQPDEPEDPPPEPPAPPQPLPEGRKRESLLTVDRARAPADKRRIAEQYATSRQKIIEDFNAKAASVLARQDELKAQTAPAQAPTDLEGGTASGGMVMKISTSASAREASVIRKQTSSSVDKRQSQLTSASGRSFLSMRSLSTGSFAKDFDKKGRRPFRCTCCCWVPKFMTGRNVGRKDGDSDSDSDSTEEEVYAEEGSEHSSDNVNELRRDSFKIGRLTSHEVDNIRLRVLEKLGVPEDDTPWPTGLKIQHYTGILRLRTMIGIKRLRVEEEAPYFPTARMLVSSLKFEAAVGVLILINAAMIGWDTMFAPDEERPWLLQISEYIFTFLFVIEFTLRIMANSWVWIFDPMNVFDAFVVWIVGVLTTYIIIPAGLAEADVIQRFAALRILRLARLCRAIRMIPVFHELWMLVKGVMECMSLLFWAGVIIGTVHFVFAVATMELVVKTEAFRDDVLVDEYFGGLLPAMFTLFQIMTFDSWAMIVRPVIYKELGAAFLFFFFIGIAGIVLFNLMTAIVVKNSFDAITEDEEAMAQLKHLEHMKVQQELREMFQDMDDDQSGTLSEKEFTDVLDDIMFIRRIKMMDIDLEELPDIFETLDDGDGQVSMDEFCTGLLRMQGVAMSRDALKATQRLKKVNEGFRDILHDLTHHAEDTFDAVESSLDATHDHFLELQALTAELLKQLNAIGIRKVVHETTRDLPRVPEPGPEKIQQEQRKAQKLIHKSDNDEGKLLAMSIPGAHMTPVPPVWVARRREAQRNVRKEKNKRLVRQRQHKPDLKEETKDEVIGGVAMEFQDEWNRLEVQIEVPPPLGSSPLRVLAGGPKHKEKQVLALPGGLVAPTTSKPAAPPPPSTPPQPPKGEAQRIRTQHADLPGSVQASVI